VEKAAGLGWDFWAFFLLSRLCLLLFFQPAASDIQVYFKYAVRGVDLQQAPFSDFKVEYPPVAYWLMVAPRSLSLQSIPQAALEDSPLPTPYYAQYARVYRWLMSVFDLGALILLLKIVWIRRPQNALVVALGYTLSTLVLGHLLYDRLDIVLTCLLSVWGYARLRATTADRGAVAWRSLSYFALGLSVSFKLIGLVAYPVVVLADVYGLRKRGQHKSGLLAPLCLGMAAIVVPFAVHYPRSGWATLDFLRYHGERGIQIESVYASVLMCLQLFGAEISTQFGHGSVDVVGSMTPWLAKLSMILVVSGILVCLGIVYKNRDEQSGEIGFQAGSLVLLLTLAFSKVLSAQYFLFGIPLLLLLTSELGAKRSIELVAVLSIAMAACTTVVFPYCWYAVHPRTGEVVNPFGLVPNLHALPCALLIGRNLTLLGITGWLASSLWRRSSSTLAAGGMSCQ
jgi:hypothetical protein